MSVNLIDNFNLHSPIFLDERQNVDAITDLDTLKDYVPVGFIVFCSEDQKHYVSYLNNDGNIDFKLFQNESTDKNDVNTKNCSISCKNSSSSEVYTGTVSIEKDTVVNVTGFSVRVDGEDYDNGEDVVFYVNDKQVSSNDTVSLSSTDDSVVSCLINGEKVGSIEFQIVYPMYTHFTSTKTQLSSIYFTKKIVGRNDNLTLNLTISNEYIHVIIPDSYFVTAIVDQNGFDITNNFYVSRAQYALGDSLTTYLYFRSEERFTVTDFQVTFRLDYINPHDYSKFTLNEKLFEKYFINVQGLIKLTHSKLLSYNYSPVAQKYSSSISSLLESMTNMRNSKGLKAIIGVSNNSIGSGNGSWEDGSFGRISIPTTCYDDNDTDYTIYYAKHSNKDGYDYYEFEQGLYIPRHSGTVDIAEKMVSFGRIKLYGSGSSVGNINYKSYIISTD